MYKIPFLLLLLLFYVNLNAQEIRVCAISSSEVRNALTREEFNWLRLSENDRKAYQEVKGKILALAVEIYKAESNDLITKKSNDLNKVLEEFSHFNEKAEQNTNWEIEVIQNQLKFEFDFIFKIGVSNLGTHMYFKDGPKRLDISDSVIAYARNKILVPIKIDKVKALFYDYNKVNRADGINHAEMDPAIWKIQGDIKRIGANAFKMLNDGVIDQAKYTEMTKLSVPKFMAIGSVSYGELGLPHKFSVGDNVSPGQMDLLVCTEAIKEYESVLFMSKNIKDDTSLIINSLRDKSSKIDELLDTSK